jgi:hypothetical protein
MARGFSSNKCSVLAQTSYTVFHIALVFRPEYSEEFEYLRTKIELYAQMWLRNIKTIYCAKKN